MGWEDPLEKEMATHSGILAWEIPWTGELGKLQFMGSQSQTQLYMQARSKVIASKVCWDQITNHCFHSSYHAE